MKSGIYCIENKINGKKYIGQGIDVEKRMWQQHKNCKHLENALKKYGADNFERYIIEYCSVEELDDKEEFYIKEMKSHVSVNGYNLLWRGFSRRGTHHSEETKKKLSIVHSNISEDTRRKMSESQKGRVQKKESKEKISRSNKGKHFLSLEQLAKMVKRGAEHRMFGKTHKQETLDKMSNKSIGTSNSQYGNKSPNASSRYYNISWNSNSGKWKVHINIKKERIHLGYYNSEIESAVVADIGAIFYYGSDCNLNFPDSRQSYIDHLNKYEINNINDLRKVIKLYFEN